MKVGDLVKWRLDGLTAVGVVTEEGMAASSGTIWWVLCEGKAQPFFEDELEVLSESR